MTIKITAKTPRGAAHATYRALMKYAKKWDWPTSDLVLWDPDRAELAGFSRSWSICWESGPYEWGTNLSMGESMTAGEFNGYGSSPPEIDLMGSPDWFTEPYWSFSLCFNT